MKGVDLPFDDECGNYIAKYVHLIASALELADDVGAIDEYVISAVNTENDVWPYEVMITIEPYTWCFSSDNLYFWWQGFTGEIIIFNACTEMAIEAWNEGQQAMLSKLKI